MISHETGQPPTSQRRPLLKRLYAAGSMPYILIGLVLLLVLLVGGARHSAMREQLALIQSQLAAQAGQLADLEEELASASLPIKEAANYVYVSRTGSKYHSNKTCSGIAIPMLMTESDAIAAGYEPCASCY